MTRSLRRTLAVPFAATKGSSGFTLVLTDHV